MDKLRRVRSTDLEVLRSMLVSEPQNDKRNDQDGLVSDISKCNESDERVQEIGDVVVKKGHLQTGMSRAPARPFLITRIESKHRWWSPSSHEPNSGAHDKENARTPSRLPDPPRSKDMLETVNKLWDKSLSEARRVFQDSLVTNRLTCHNGGHLVQIAATSQHLSPLSGPHRTGEGLPEPSRAHASARPARTEHRLVGDEPAVGLWLERKERELQRQRDQQVQQSLLDSAERHQAHMRQQHRQEAAQLAFDVWFQSKRARPPRDAEETASVSSDSSSEPGPAQAGRQPRPSRPAHARPSRCAPRPKSAASFVLRSATRMKVAGHRMALGSSMPVSQRALLLARTARPGPPCSARLDARPRTALPQARHAVRSPCRARRVSDSLSRHAERAGGARSYSSQQSRSGSASGGSASERCSPPGRGPEGPGGDVEADPDRASWADGAHDDWREDCSTASSEHSPN